MSILVYNLADSPAVDDLATYAPFVTAAQKAMANIQGFIAHAERLAQGPYGSGRPLEKQLITGETYTSLATKSDMFERGQRAPMQSVFMRVWPVVSITTLEARSVGGKDTWGRELPVTDWATLTASDYNLETNRGQLVLTTSRFYNMLRITYTGGFDFSNADDTDDPNYQDMQSIKMAIGLILQDQLGVGSSAGGKFIKSVSQTGITYERRGTQQSEPASMVPPDAKAILMRYSPRNA